MKTLLKSLMTAFVLALLAGCQAPLELKSTGGGGTIVLDLNRSPALGRVLKPNADFFPTVFDLHLVGPGLATKDLLNQTLDQGLEIHDLALGSWVITVDGKSNGTVVGRGTLTLNVIEAGTTHGTIQILPLAGTGTLKLDFVVDAVEKTKLAVKAEFWKAQETPTVLALTPTASGLTTQTTHPSGEYLVRLTASQDGLVVWGLEEVVYLLPDLTTSASFTLDQNTVNKAPPAPINFRVTSTTLTNASMAWGDVSLVETSYELQRRDGVNDWSSLATLNPNITQYSDSTVESGTVYLYRLRARNNWGDSAWVELPLQVPLQFRQAGPLALNTVWTKDRIYLIERDVTVPVGVTLTIEPGTRIRFNAGQNLKVEGRLHAQGTRSAPIVFGYDSPDWGYVALLPSSSDSSVVSWAELNRGELWISDSYPTIEHLTFRDCPDVGLWLTYREAPTGSPSLTLDRITVNNAYNHGLYLDNRTNQNVTIRNSTFSNSRQYDGLFVFVGGRLTVEDSRFLRNARNGLWWNNPGGESYFQGQSLVVRRSQFTSNGRDGLSTEGMYSSWSASGNDKLFNLEITDSSMNDNGRVGIYAWALNDNPNRISLIARNHIARNAWGVELELPGGWTWPTHAFLRFENNSVVDNRTGGLWFAHYQGQLSVTATGNYFSNPSASWEVQLGDRAKWSGLALDLSNNLWDTPVLATVKAKVFDFDDDATYATVNVEPFLNLGGLVTDGRSPASGSAVTSTVVPFSWRTLGGRASSYDLQIADNAVFDAGHVLVSLTDLPVANYTLSGREADRLLTSGTPYFWRVRAIDGSGVAQNWSGVSSFTPTLTAPDLLGPADALVLYEGWQPRLSWMAVSGADSYHLLVTQDAAGYVDTVVRDTGYTFAQALTPGHTYQWSVAQVDQNGVEGPPSAARTFRLPAPGLALPIDNQLPAVQNLQVVGPSQAAKALVRVTYYAFADGQPEFYRWFVDGVEVQADTSPWYDFNPSSRGYGTYTITTEALVKGKTYTAEQTVQVVN